VAKEASLITLESDKATMEIPSSDAGVVRELRVKVGDKVAKGTLIALLEAEAAAAAPPSPGLRWRPRAAAQKPAAGQAAAYSGASDLSCDVVVLGSGPGGYSARFAPRTSHEHVLVERYPVLGACASTWGCIPSKALLPSPVMDEAKHLASTHRFGEPGSI